LIEEGLNVRTTRAVPLQKCLIKDKITSRTIMELKPSEEIIEVSIDRFSKIIGFVEENIAGSYCTKTGRIFMIKKEWCFSNLIHEALHSRSSFSKMSPPPSNLQFVYDGLTELLTGVVLSRKIPDCYRKWQILNSCFLEPYLAFVKPWYYLTFKIDVSPIKSLYFNTKVKRPYEELGRLLEQLLESKFQNVFSNYRSDDYSISDRFNDQLAKIFPKDFAEFQMTPLTRIELDHFKT